MAEGVVVLVKVAATRVDVDAVTGAFAVDGRFLDASPADRAALTVGGALARARGAPLSILCFGAPFAIPVLRELAAAAGCPATLLQPTDAPDSLTAWVDAYPSGAVAAALARAARGAETVLCGDHSLDRGSGSVPGAVAAALDLPQALGLVEVDVAAGVITRRLGHGWRERLVLPARGVLSVEAPVARTLRGSPGALLAASVTTSAVEVPRARGVTYAPYRPPVRVAEPPSQPAAARRAMEVIGALSPPRTREVLALEPAAGARAILEHLAAWGYR